MEAISFRKNEFSTPALWVLSFAESDTNEGTIALSLPGSDLFPLDLFHARRGLVGGTLARCWFSFERAGVTYVVHFGQGMPGQGIGDDAISFADPTVYVPALALATPIYVNLGTSSRDATYVADAIVSALDLAGVSGSSSVAEVLIIENASNLTIPPDVDMTDTRLRGMFGTQRDDWGDGGDGTTLNQNGGNNGTGSIHLGQPGDALARGGRILGTYVWATNGMQPRLGAGIGPDYPGLVSPGVIVMLGEGIVTEPQLAMSYGGAFGGTAFGAASFASTDHIWAFYRDDDGGGVRFRSHGGTPEGSGDIPASEQLHWDTGFPRASSDAFGGTYTSLPTNFFTIYIPIGVIFELPDDSGNYYANGSFQARIGDQNDDISHGTQFLVAPADINDETTHHRFLAPNWTDVNIVSVTRGIGTIDEGFEDSRLSVYQWSDLDFPSTTPAVLLQDCGMMSLLQDEHRTNVLASPIPIGTEVIGTDATLSIGFNYVTLTGIPVYSYVLPVFLDIGASSSWLNCWVDDRETWHDDIRGASGARAPNAGVTEYRTRVVDGNLGMPTAAWADTWPDPMNTAPGDSSPAAIALDWYIVERVGMEAV